ncbi:MAG: hypothetical protein EOM20_10490 [Spartobacteria bacterium]|nr:hypothetical protein [Spartobacteria bacterium]
MGIERVAGEINYGNGGGIDYVPILYAKQMLLEYLETAVVPGISNNDYEGEIKEQGDQVIISTMPEVSIEDHEKGAPVGDYEQLSSPSVKLDIDYAKKYKFRIGSIDQAQSRFILSPKFLKKAEYAMEIAIDGTVFGVIRGTAGSNNDGVSAGADSGSFDLGVTTDPKVLTKDNVLDWIADMACVLHEESVPDDNVDRWLGLAPWITNLIDKSELANAAYSGDEKSRFYKNRYIGQLKGFNIHQTMQQTKTVVGGKTEFDVSFGHKTALTFATQLVENESLKTGQYFGKLYRGLQVFGFKTTIPEGLGHSVVTPQ